MLYGSQHKISSISQLRIYIYYNLINEYPEMCTQSIVPVLARICWYVDVIHDRRQHFIEGLLHVYVLPIVGYWSTI